MRTCTLAEVCKKYFNILQLSYNPHSETILDIRTLYILYKNHSSFVSVNATQRFTMLIPFLPQFRILILPGLLLLYPSLFSLELYQICDGIMRLRRGMMSSYCIARWAKASV